MKAPAGGMTLAEYLASLTPEQRAQREALLAAQQARVREPDPEQEPILADLRAIGVEVHSVWSQFLQPDEQPEIYEVLLRHLRRGGYKETTMEGMALKFARPGAGKYWWDLRELYLTADGAHYLDGLASSLGQCARRQHLDALIELLDHKDRGSSRVLLLHKIKRLGGERGLAIVESLRDDPELGTEARRLTKPRKSRGSK